MSDADSMLKSSTEAMKKGDLSEARTLLSELLDSNRSVGEAMQLLAVVERRAGNHKTASRYLEQLLAYNPENPVLHNNLANCLKDMEQLSTAEQHYRKALQLRNDYSDASLNLAILLKQEGKLTEALSITRKALEHDKTQSGLWHILGLIYREQGHIDAAVRALEQGIERSPGNGKLLNARAKLEAERGGRALPYYEQALRVAPGNPDIMLGHAMAKLEAGEAESAVTELTRLTDMYPEWVKGHSALAKIRWQWGDTENFIDSFRDAISKFPDSVSLYIGYFGTLMRAGRYKQVLQEIEKAKEVIDDRQLLERYIAVCASETGDVDRAESCFAKWLVDDDKELQNAYLRQLLRTGRYQKAAESAKEQAIEYDNMAAWPYLALAWRLTGDERSQWLEGHGRLVSYYDIEEYSARNAALRSRLRDLHRAKIHPFDQSMREGTQTDGNLFLRSDPELANLKQCLEHYISTYIAGLPERDQDHPFLRFRDAGAKFLASYSVLLRSGGYHVSHMHPDSWISCCFYIDVPDSVGSSPDDPSGWLAIGKPPDGLGIDLPARNLVKPVPGRLVIFPSIMWHGTIPFESGERLSVVSDLVSEK